MKSRAELIKNGRIFQVYPDQNPDDIRFEGSRTACFAYAKQVFGMKLIRNGTIRIGQLIFEDGPKEYVDNLE